MFDSNQRLIYLGQKIDTIAENYNNNKQKRALIAEFFRIVQIENSKRKKVTPKEKKEIKSKEERVKKEVEKKITIIRKEKKEKKRIEALKPDKPKVVLKVGDHVRMEDGRAIGSIDKIEKNKAVVNYGIFTTNVSLDMLELVKRSK